MKIRILAKVACPESDDVSIAIEPISPTPKEKPVQRPSRKFKQKAVQFDRAPLLVGQIEDWLRRKATDDQVIDLASYLHSDEPEYRALLAKVQKLTEKELRDLIKKFSI
jgi:hypothetical protein